MTPVFVALTAEGLRTARRAQAALGGEVHAPLDSGGHSPSPIADLFYANISNHLRTLFSEGRPIVGVCAAGILIRILAPLLADKHDEPAVLALSDDGASVVPLLGGHRGANDLARALAEALGGHAAITTAGDNRFGVALDAPPEGWTLANPEDAKPVMTALLAGAAARLEGRAKWLEKSSIPFSDDGAVRLVATTRAMKSGESKASALTSPSRGGRNPEERSESGFRKGGMAQRQPPSRSSLSLRSANSDLPSGGRLDGARSSDALTLVYHPRRLAIGLGCERGAGPAEAIALMTKALDEAGLAPKAVALVASLDLKADEPAVLAAAEHLGVPARFFTAVVLEVETPRLRNPSDAVFREVGCHGVAEGAALAAAGPDAALVVAKRKSARVTCAIAEAPEVIDATKAGRARGRLAIVGIGPGSADWLTPEARRLLQTSDAAVGYSLYLDLVAPLIFDAERFDFALGAEEARVRQALALAAAGRSVALVSSGDAGIYAMAALAFECLDESPAAATGGTFSHGEKVVAERPAAGAARIEIVVAPGISAMQAAAARAGAPLGHDFCAISLSDLLTPWEAIEARIQAAAEADFVVAFYNPVSQRRRTQLGRAKAILLQHRPADTPVVIARKLGRMEETIATVALSELSTDAVDMLTIVIVGASTTRQVRLAGRNWTYTPRGYERKRRVDAAE